MLKNFKTILWYYKRSSANAFLIDIFLLIFSIIVFVKHLDLVCLIALCTLIYSKSKNCLLSLENPVLAGTPIKIKDVINSNSLILWIKAATMMFIGIITSLFFHQISLHTVIVALGYLVFAFPFFNLLFSVEYSVIKIYRTLTFYILVIALGGVFFYIDKLDIVISFASILGMSSLILLISKTLEKRLTFEKILIKEEQ